MPNHQVTENGKNLYFELRRRDLVQKLLSEEDIADFDNYLLSLEEQQTGQNPEAREGDNQRADDHNSEEMLNEQMQ